MLSKCINERLPLSVVNMLTISFCEFSILYNLHSFTCSLLGHTRVHFTYACHHSVSGSEEFIYYWYLF